MMYREPKDHKNLTGLSLSGHIEALNTAINDSDKASFTALLESASEQFPFDSVLMLLQHLASRLRKGHRPNETQRFFMSVFEVKVTETLFNQLLKLEDSGDTQRDLEHCWNLFQVCWDHSLPHECLRETALYNFMRKQVIKLTDTDAKIEAYKAYRRVFKHTLSDYFYVAEKCNAYPYANCPARKIDECIAELEMIRANEAKYPRKKALIDTALNDDDMGELSDIITSSEDRSRAVDYAIRRGIKDPKNNPLVIAMMMKFSDDWTWDARVEALLVVNETQNTEMMTVVETFFYKMFYQEIVQAKNESLKLFLLFRRYYNQTKELIDPLGNKLLPAIMSQLDSVSTFHEKMAILNQALELCMTLADHFIPKGLTRTERREAYERTVCKALVEEISIFEMMHNPAREGTHATVFFGYATDYKLGTVTQPAVYESDQAQNNTFERHKI